MSDILIGLDVLDGLVGLVGLDLLVGVRQTKSQILLPASERLASPAASPDAFDGSLASPPPDAPQGDPWVLTRVVCFDPSWERRVRAGSPAKTRIVGEERARQEAEMAKDLQVQ